MTRSVCLLMLCLSLAMDIQAQETLTNCQGRSKSGPLRRSKSRPVDGEKVLRYSGAKGLWSVAEEALRP
jgi:hypothetical protein